MAFVLIAIGAKQGLPLTIVNKFEVCALKPLKFAFSKIQLDLQIQSLIQIESDQQVRLPSSGVLTSGKILSSDRHYGAMTNVAKRA